MNDKNFFVLNRNCILIKGALRGALYDLKTGNVFSIDETSMKILSRLNSGEDLFQTLRGIDINQEKAVSYLNNLESQRLGYWKDVFERKEMLLPPDLNEVLKYVFHLELTTGCNLRCLHCYNESEISKKNLGNEPSSNHWKNAIGDACKMGSRRIQFIGGEPFLKRRLLFEFIPFACDVGYKSLEVSSNGTLMSDADFKVLKGRNVNLALSFYSYQSQIHDLITNKNGSWRKTLQTIRKSLDIGVNLRVSIVVMKQNKEDIDKTVEFLKSLGVKDVGSTTVEPAGRGCNENLITADICKRQVLSKPCFAKIYQNIFWRNRAGHNCFSEQICIGADGAVYPCLAERQISFGNIRFASLNSIFSSDIAERFRNLSKDYVEVCRDCEYRYCCFDCRVKAKDFLDKDIHCKPWWCLYDPYTGKWRQGNNTEEGGDENGKESGMP